jgi:hypothetical protein
MKIAIELDAQQWNLVMQALDELPRKVSNKTFVDIYTQLKTIMEAGQNDGTAGAAQQ